MAWDSLVDVRFDVRPDKVEVLGDVLLIVGVGFGCESESRWGSQDRAVDELARPEDNCLVDVWRGAKKCRCES